MRKLEVLLKRLELLQKMLIEAKGNLTQGNQIEKTYAASLNQVEAQALKIRDFFNRFLLDDEATLEIKAAATNYLDEKEILCQTSADLFDNLKQEFSTLKNALQSQSSNKGYFNKDFLASVELLEKCCDLTQYIPQAKTFNETEHLKALAVRLQQLKLEQNSFFQATLDKINLLRQNIKKNAAIRCFISYAWPSIERSNESWTQDFIQLFSKHLQQAGITTLLDVKDSHFGYNSYEHMLKIQDCDFVILFGTESLMDKHLLGTSSICTELNLIRIKRERDAYKNYNNYKNKNHVSVIPIVLSGNMRSSLPIEYEKYTVVESFTEKNYTQVLKELLSNRFFEFNDKAQYDAIWEEAKNTLNELFLIPTQTEIQEFWDKLKVENAKNPALQNAIKGLSLSSSSSNISIHAEQKIPCVHNFKILRNSNFTGRSSLLNQIKQSLKPLNNHTIVQAITGLGGIGKTQVMVECAYQAYEEGCYSLIWWFNGETVDQDFLALSDALGVEKEEKNERRVSATKILLQQFFQQQKSWLFIFDDIEEYKKIEHIIPATGGHVLITSRNKNIHPSTIIVMDVYLRTESVDFIFKIIGNSLRNNQTIAMADRLAEMLGDLPLALSQASSYCKETGISLNEYISLYQNTRRELWQDESPPQDYHSTISVTWLINIREIKKYSAGIELLNLSAYLSPNYIPRYLLNYFIKNNLEYNKAIKVLQNYSMITINQDSAFISIHKLVQTVVRDTCNESKDEKKYITMLASGILTFLPNMNTLEHQSKGVQTSFSGKDYQDGIIRVNQLLPHFESLIENMSENHDIPLSEFYFNVAAMRLSMGDIHYCGILLLKALKIKEKLTHAKQDLELARIHHALYGYYQILSDHSQALLHAEKALEICKEILGEKHQMTVFTSMTLGSLFCQIGYIKSDLVSTLNGVQCLERVLPTAVECYGNDHPLVIELSNKVSENYRFLGELPKSHLYLHKNFSKKNLDILKQKNYHKKSLLSQLRYLEEVHGKKHYLVIIILHALGQICADNNQYDESLTYYLQAKEIASSLFGINHPAYLISIGNIAIAYAEQGQSELALEHYQEALNLAETIQDDRSISLSYFEIGLTYFDLKDFKNALLYFEKAFVFDSTRLGEKHLCISDTLYRMGECHFGFKDFNKALNCYQQSLQICHQISLKKNFPLFGDLYLAIVDSYYNQQKYQHAIDFYNEAIRGNECTNPELYYKIAESYHLTQDLENAIKFYQEALALKPDYYLCHQNLACCFHLSAITKNIPVHFDEAEKFFLKALESNDSSSLADYANFLYERSRFDEALIYLKKVLESDVAYDATFLLFDSFSKITIPCELSKINFAEGKMEYLATAFACYLATLIYVKKGMDFEAKKILLFFKNLIKNNGNKDDQELYAVTCQLLNPLPTINHSPRLFNLSINDTNTAGDEKNIPQAFKQFDNSGDLPTFAEQKLKNA